MIRAENMCLYDATLKPCPFCEGAEQEVFGVRNLGGWKWDIKCKSCGNQFVEKESESEVIAAWNRRPKENEAKQEVKQHEVEQDGDITWDQDGFYDLVVKCVKRYAGECRSRLGAD